MTLHAETAMIHVLGDSHTSLFTGLHGVCPRVPDDCPQALPGFCVWHLGAYLAYSFGTSRHAVRATARGCVAKMPQDARVLVWMGEIDCRNHVCKHASSAAGIRRTAREVAERYVRAAAAMLRGREVGFVTVPPPTISQHGNQQQPTNGTFAQRRMAAEAFNAGLQRTAKAAGAMVLDVYELLSDAKGGPNPAFFADGVHADSRCLPLVLDQLRECGWMRGDDAAMDVARALAMVPPPATAAGLPGGLLDARDARQVLIELAAARCKVATGRARGAGSIAIFGAGQHTRSMGWEPFERLGLRIACVLDDQAPEDGRGQLRGVPLLRPSKSRRGTPAFDVVLISSDAHEDVLMSRAVAVYGSRLAIIPIYSWRDS